MFPKSSMQSEQKTWAIASRTLVPLSLAIAGFASLTPQSLAQTPTQPSGSSPESTARRMCPSLCQAQGATWNNRWRVETTPTGSRIVCQCEKSQPTSTTPSPAPSPTPTPVPVNNTSTSMSQEFLVAHNKYRSEVGIPALTWSNTLANDAQQWANHLASLGGRQLVHSQSSQRPNQGENLWLGTAGRFSYTQMVDGWGSEKRYFRNGTFPNVSTTGNWADVGHYTQIVWRKTTQVGCGLAKAGGNDILVCRYSPPGNFMGQPVY